jgi:hypothetical protein
MAAGTIPLKSLYLEDSKKVEVAGGCYLVLFNTIFFVYCLFFWVKPIAKGGGLEFRMFVCSFLWFGLCYVSCFVLIMHCFCEILST